jgi:hypothetical protein
METKAFKKEYQKPVWEKQQLFERYALVCTCIRRNSCTSGKRYYSANQAS